MTRTGKIICFLFTELCFCALTEGFRNLCSVILRTDMVYWKLEINPAPLSPAVSLTGLAGGILFLLCRDCRKYIRWTKTLGVLLLLFPLEWICGKNYLFIPLMLMITGWAVFRFSAVYGNRFRLSEKRESLCGIPRKTWSLFVVLVYLLAAAWGFYMQNHAFRSLFLAYSDWGIYADAYLKIANGSAVWQEWLSSGWHWNGFVNLVMAFFLKLCPAPETMFLINSLLIYAACPLIWLFCGRKKLPVLHSLLLSFAVLLNPVFSNQSLSLFYGFHPINFMIVLIILFFLFREEKNRIGMGITFLLSLFVQETVFIFWFGYGLYLLCSRKWKSGAAICCAMPVLFYLVSSVILPGIYGWKVYGLACFYNNLGTTPFEIACSPFTRPAAFFRACFQYENFAFGLTLLLPLIFLILPYPVMLLTVLPLFAGICLRDSGDVKNVVLWYGVEITTLLFVTAVLNLEKLSGRKCSPIRDLLLTGLGRYSGRTVASAAMIAGLVTISGAYLCCGMTAYCGKYNYQRIGKREDHSPDIQEIMKSIPENSRVLASERLRMHFVFQHKTESLFVPRKAGDVLVIALNDARIDGTVRSMEQLRRELAADPFAHPLYFRSSGDGIDLAVIQILSEKRPKAELPRISVPEFRKS